MDIRFSPHNTHLEAPKDFPQNDPHLKHLKRLKLVHQYELLDRLPTDQPGIYTISGGRQIGKTTLLKQWMNQLLNQGIYPDHIIFLTGELIDDHHSLVRILTEVSGQPAEHVQFIIIDEINYVKQWDKGIKFLADAGLLENIILLLTGSDSIFIKEARMRFPGRRGKADTMDFHLYPLSFRECVQLKRHVTDGDITFDGKKTDITPTFLNTLYKEFEDYLIHGGYLTAINNMAEYGYILPATLNTYSDWIRGDFLKRGKQEHYLHQIIKATFKRYGSQITWNNLLNDLTIDHPKTVSDYVNLLVEMDAAFIQEALVEDKLAAAPKKAKKLIFTDPFIFHALRSWISPVKAPFENQIKPALSNFELTSKIVEACVISHYRRYYQTYYIKSKGEVDIAYIDQDRFWPVEIKWTTQTRPKDMKQITKYPNGKILTKTKNFQEFNGIPSEPIPWSLFLLDSN